MTQKEVQDLVLADWLWVVERRFGCPAELDESLTEEFDWGWVFCLVPLDPDACKLLYKRARFACDRTTGTSVVVGTRGIEDAAPRRSSSV